MTGRRVVGYIRVSSDKQVEHGVSLAAQRDKLEVYTKLYDLTLVDIITDAGGSAKTLNRPDLQRALGMLTHGQADALLVTKLDRLTRSVKDLGQLIERYFEKRYALMSVADQLDTRSANGRMMLNLLTTIAQWEREVIGERTKEALQHKRANGEKTGGLVPYGFQAVDGKLVEDPTEQDMLTLIQEWRDAGMSLQSIATDLTRRGYMTRKGTPFTAMQVSRLVRVAA